MSEAGGLENFSIEGSEGIDTAALERLRERMRQAQAQGARDQKREAKQKKVEDNLFQVIVALMRNQKQQGMIKVVTGTIGANIPAYFIVSILALRFEAIRKKVGLDFTVATEKETPEASESKSLVPGNFSNQALPLKTKIELDIWFQFLITESQKEPTKVLAKIKQPGEDDQANTAVKSLVSYVIQDYLQHQKLEFIGQNIVVFASNFCDSLVEFLSDYLNKQKQVK